MILSFETIIVLRKRWDSNSQICYDLPVFKTSPHSSRNASIFLCSENEIRTHGTFTSTRFPSVLLKPLGHLTIFFLSVKERFISLMNLWYRPDLNQQRSRLQRDALHWSYDTICGTGEFRNPDLLGFNQTLLPLSYSSIFLR